MNSHWPLLIALVMIGAAVVYGVYMQTEYEQRAKVVSDVRQLPAKYASTPPLKPTLSVAQYAPTPPTAPIVNAATRQPNPAVPMPRMAVPGMAPAGVDRDTALNSLRAAITQRFGAQPTQTNNGYAVALEGVRLEVDFNAWSIALYNDNKAQPAIQSDSFVAMLNLVGANLDFDVNAAPAQQADGKITRRAISKLGRLSMLTDPATNNSVVIRPIQSKTARPATAIQNGNAANGNAMRQPITAPNPAAPAPAMKMVRPPVQPTQPVKPPVNDQF